MKINRVLYIAFGCIGVGLGAVGVTIPLLPSIPFLLLAAFCFAKSSQRLYNWYIGTKLYKNHLQSYVRGQGMTWNTKLRIITIVTVAITLGFLLMRNAPVGRVILSAVWLGHILFFIFGVKTITQKTHNFH